MLKLHDDIHVTENDGNQCDLIFGLPLKTPPEDIISALSSSMTSSCVSSVCSSEAISSHLWSDHEDGMYCLLGAMFDSSNNVLPSASLAYYCGNHEKANDADDAWSCFAQPDSQKYGKTKPLCLETIPSNDDFSKFVVDQHIVSPEKPQQKERKKFLAKRKNSASKVPVLVPVVSPLKKKKESLKVETTRVMVSMVSVSPTHAHTANQVVMKQRQCQQHDKHLVDNGAVVEPNNNDDVRRKKASAFARSILLDWLVAHKDKPYPSNEEKLQLSASTGMTVHQITLWMGNMRKRRLTLLSTQSGTRPHRAAGGKADSAFLGEVSKRDQWKGRD